MSGGHDIRAPDMYLIGMMVMENEMAELVQQVLYQLLFMQYPLSAALIDVQVRMMILNQQQLKEYLLQTHILQLTLVKVHKVHLLLTAGYVTHWHWMIRQIQHLRMMQLDHLWKMMHWLVMEMDHSMA